MKISEIIEKFEDIAHVHGDVNVVVEHLELFSDPRVLYDGVDAVVRF